MSHILPWLLSFLAFSVVFLAYVVLAYIMYILYSLYVSACRMYVCILYVHVHMLKHANIYMCIIVICLYTHN